MPKMRIGLDFDGTLVSCRERHTKVLQYACRCLGVLVDVDAVWCLKRKGADTISALQASGVESGLASRVGRAWLAEIEGLQWLGFDVLLAQPADLASVAMAGHSLHLISARAVPANLRQQLHALGLELCFESVDSVTPASAVEEKARALSRRRIDVYIGDSETDLRAAQQAGVLFRGVSSGMREESELLARGACEVSDRLTTYLEAYAERDCTS